MSSFRLGFFRLSPTANGSSGSCSPGHPSQALCWLLGGQTPTPIPHGRFFSSGVCPAGEAPGSTHSWMGKRLAEASEQISFPEGSCLRNLLKIASALGSLSLPGGRNFLPAHQHECQLRAGCATARELTRPVKKVPAERYE